MARDIIARISDSHSAAVDIHLILIRERGDALSPSAAPAATTSAIPTSRKSSAGSEMCRVSSNSRNGSKPRAFGLSDNNGRLKGDPSKDALSDHR